MLVKYIKYNFLYFIILIYFTISIVLKNFGIVDITIPCLFKTFLHYECPGCGLTRASIHIINFEFIEAFKTKPIIFLIIPLFIIFSFINYRNFIKTHS